MKLKNFLKQMLAFITGLYKKLDQLIDKLAPIAINVVNVIKNVNESWTGDVIEQIVTAAIPGKKDDVLVAAARARLKTLLPKLLLQLNMIESIAGIKNPDEQVRAILAKINMSSDPAKNAFYHALSAMIVEAMSDGKLTWSESVQIVEFYYKNIYKKQ